MDQQIVPTRALRRDVSGVAALAVAIVIAAWLLPKTFHLSLLTYGAVYAIAAVGLQMLFGLAGQISLCQAAFFGIGAYASALLGAAGMSAPFALLLSVALAGGGGWLVSRPILKLTTDYLAMGTLALGVICFIVFAQATQFTGGMDPGIISMPPLSFMGWTADTPRLVLCTVGAVLCAVLVLCFSLVHSRIGRALMALRSSEVAASGLGVDVVRYKTATFTLAAALAGLAGGLFAYVQGAFNASVFGVGLSIELLVMVVIGSLSTLWGAVFGALFLTILPSLLEHLELYKLLIYGALLTVIMVFMPDGLAKAVFDAARAWRRRKELA